MVASLCLSDGNCWTTTADLAFRHMTLSKKIQQVVGALQSCTTLKASKMPLVSHLNSWYKNCCGSSRLAQDKWPRESKARRYGGCARRDTHPGQLPDSKYLHSEDRVDRKAQLCTDFFLDEDGRDAEWNHVGNHCGGAAIKRNGDVGRVQSPVLEICADMAKDWRQSQKDLMDEFDNLATKTRFQECETVCWTMVGHGDCVSCEWCAGGQDCKTDNTAHGFDGDVDKRSVKSVTENHLRIAARFETTVTL